MKTLTLGALFLMSGSAYAQDLDLDTDKKKKKKEFKVEIDQDVKEITKGWYAKSSLGGAVYLLNMSQSVQPGAVLGLSVGQDFIDQSTFSAAWEASFAQGVHNGLTIEEQDQLGCAQTFSCIQGDLRTFTLQASAEASWYIAKRYGIGIRAGAGLMIIPLLVEETYYLERIPSSWSESQIHSTPHPVGMAGLTFEYYTKLAHFSVGVDVDVAYSLGFDLGVGGAGYLKYTF